MNDNYPLSPSYNSNPFEKYKTARTAGLPPGIVGIGTGSTSRFQPRRKGGDRKKIVRGLAIVTAIALIWFIWGSSLGTVGRGNGIVDEVGSSAGSTQAKGATSPIYEPPTSPVASNPLQPKLEKATLVMLIRYVGAFFFLLYLLPFDY